MAITIGGQSLLNSDLHGDVLDAETFRPADARASFFGVEGETEIRGETTGRDLVCRVTLKGDTSSDAADAIDALHGKIGLHGTLALAPHGAAGITANFPNCTFKGFSKQQPGIRLEPVSNKWICDGILRWRQLSRT